MLSGYIQKYSTKEPKQIEQRAFNLRQLLRKAEFSREGCEWMKTYILPLLDSKLAVATLKKYMDGYDVNYANNNHVTLLHLLVLYFPHLVGYLLENPKFTHLNYKAVCLQSGFVASALDIALSRWLDRKCDYQVIERLLKYRATVPQLQANYLPGRSILLDICHEMLFAEKPQRTEDEVVRMLALLARYGFDLISAHKEFTQSWLADDATVASIQETTGLSVLEQCERIDNLLKKAFKEFLDTHKTDPEYRVEQSNDRIATVPFTRRISNAPGFSLHADSRQSQSSLAAMMYGDDNRLSDNEGLEAIFKPS